MSKKPLVSVITYCYNGESYISNYFEGILSQTYTNVELIFIDNGSEDNTYDIADSFRERLAKKGIIYKLIRKEKNNPRTLQVKLDAISMMNGEYFFGCDSDDIIYPQYIERMVSYLEKNPNKGIVFCKLNAVNEYGVHINVYGSEKQTRPYEGFENLIQCKKSVFPPHSYMMSKKWFDKINPEHKFYISDIGENYQLQIPFLYYNLQGYIDDILAQYTVRAKSVSHDMDIHKKLKFLDQQETIIAETLKLLGNDVYEKYNHLNHKRVCRDKFYLSCATLDKNLIFKCYSNLKKEGLSTFKSQIFYIVHTNKFLYKIYSLFR